MIVNTDHIPYIEYDTTNSKFNVSPTVLTTDKYLFASKNSVFCKNNSVFLLTCKYPDNLHKVNLLDICGSEVLSKVRNKQLMLAIDSTAEGFYEIVDEVYKLADLNDLPISQLLLITSCYGLDDYTKKYSEKLNIEVFQFWEKTAQKQLISYKLQDYTPLDYVKKYICLNRLPRYHRIALLHLLIENNTLNDGYVSFAKNTLNHEGVRQLFSGLSDRLIYDKQIDELLPMNVDVTDMRINLAYGIGSEFLRKEYYKQSYFTIVTETNYTKSFPLHFTEKIFRPIIYRHPFIAVGNCGLLRELRNLGYKTYNNIIDESYDTVDNDSVRLSMIANEVKRLCNLDTDQLKQFVTDSKIIADYNFECIKSKSNFIK